MLDSREHEIAHVLSLDAFRGGDMAHGLAVAAVERESDADLVAILASDFEAIGTPTQIGLLDCHASIMPALRAASMLLQQQAMGRI